jgi:hypothetical protein
MAPAPDQAQVGTQGHADGQAGAKKSELADEHGGPWNTFWANAEYIHWWTKPGSVTVPLLTVNNGATILGNSDIDYEDRSGGRITAGMWVDGQHIYGLEAGGFLLARPTITATVGSDAGGSPTLSRPITNALTGAPASVIVSLPGTFSGTLTQASESRLWGVEANVVRNLACKRHFEADLLAGFRFLDLDENLKINQATTVLAPNATVQFPNLSGGLGSVVSLLDSFSTRNQLFAGQVGGRFCLKAGCWTVEGMGKVALGPMHEALTVQGTSTLMTPAGASSTANGGLLALPGANLGHTSTNWITVAPEVGVQLGYQLTENLRLQFGYNYLYINNVIRPGNQINTTVNPPVGSCTWRHGSGSKRGADTAATALSATGILGARHQRRYRISLLTLIYRGPLMSGAMPAAGAEMGGLSVEAAGVRAPVELGKVAGGKGVTAPEIPAPGGGVGELGGGAGGGLGATGSAGAGLDATGSAGAGLPTAGRGAPPTGGCPTGCGWQTPP